MSNILCLQVKCHDHNTEAYLPIGHITLSVCKLLLYKFDARETKHRIMNDESFVLLANPQEKLLPEYDWVYKINCLYTKSPHIFLS